MKKNRILNAKHDSFLLFVCIFFLYRAVHAIFVWTQNRANSRTRGETIFSNKNKTERQKIAGNCESGHLFEIVFFFFLFVLRVIGHFPFVTGEIVALDVFNVDIVVFVFQFTGIGGSVLVALAAALELVRL